MKTTLSFILILSALPVAAFAKEGQGGKEGHGGVSIVCRDTNTAINSVELLDTFEGNNQYGLKIGGSALPVEDQLELAQTRLASRPDLLEEFQNELAYIQAHISFLKEGVGLNPTDDAFPVLNKKGCDFEQLAVYTYDGKLLVDSELYERLSVTDQAALYVHEAIYKMARARGATSSVNSRKLTAYLFTRPNQPAVVKELLASMFAPKAPPAPIRQSAYDEISPGDYRTENSRFCSFRILKNDLTHRMYLVWTGNDCKTVGRSVTLSCNWIYCEGNSDSTLIWVTPVSGSHVEFAKGHMVNGTFYYYDRLMYSR